ncbi:MAG: signal peptidase I [Clostridiales bacterium]|nr:signal peptidase I [Clostridiales bacterium]
MNVGIEDGDALLDRQKNKTPIVFDIVLLGFVLLFSGLVFFYYMYSFSPIKGNSMLNTIESGQCVLLQRRYYTLNRGDIITIDVPTDDDDDKEEEAHILIKRVIGLEGDKILFVKSQYGQYVDMYICEVGQSKFKLMNEPYILEKMKWVEDPDSSLRKKISVITYKSEQRITEIDMNEAYSDSDKAALQTEIAKNCTTVPKEEIFFLGDNRNYSSDSRNYGTRPKNKIIGKVIKIIDQGSAAERILRFMFNNYEST